MAGEGLGMAGAGAGMINRLFDAGLDLGTQFGRQQLIRPQPAAQLAPGSFTVTNEASRPAGGGFQLDQRTILIGAALIIGAIVLAKVL